MAQLSKTLFVRGFLSLYLVILLVSAVPEHLSEGLSLPIGLAFLIGAVIAYLAHRKAGIVGLAFLLVHMSIEWNEYAHSFHEFTTTDYGLYAVHVVLDLIFMWVLLREVTKHPVPFMFLSLAGVALGAVLSSFIFATEVMALPGEFLHVGTLSGIIVCTVLHLFPKAAA